MATRRFFGSKWKTVFVFASVFTLFFEILLRLINFRFGPDTEFGYPRPVDFSQLRYDPELFWTLNLDDESVNSWGFPGDEIVLPKPKGVYRILFLGDSIMQAGYPEQVKQCLQEAGFSNIEAIPLVINGYSSYQGRILAEKYGLRIEPDLVVVQFGWNDHWLAYGEPDAEKVFPPPHPLSIPFHTFHKVYDRVRVLQALGWAWEALLGQGNHQSGEVRVPLAQYRENLDRIRTLFEGENIPVFFATAPSAHTQWGVPDEIIQRGFAKDTESVIQLHQEYNEMVREVAGEVRLLDLDTEFESFSADELRKLFQEDGIHPTAEGHKIVAANLWRQLEKLL